jgi:hypothetical protein
MRPRHAALLSPLECAVPNDLPISILYAPVTSLESALTSHFQVAENTATLSPVECALTRLSPATPLESALTKTPGVGVGSRVGVLDRHLRHSPNPQKCFPVLHCSCSSAFPSSFFSVNSVFSAPSVLNPSFSLDFQLSTGTLFSQQERIGFPASHPLKSPHCPHLPAKWTGQTRKHDEYDHRRQ